MPTSGSFNQFTEEVQTSTIGDTIPTPPIGSLALFSNQNGQWYIKNSSGVVTLLGGISVVQNTDGTITISGGSGPTATVSRPHITGDIDIPVASNVSTLASVISAGGPTGSASVVPVITYDAKGRLTAVTTATITPAAIGALSAITSASVPSSTKGTVVIASGSIIENPINWAGVLYVDANNSQGWTGADFGAWVNSAYAYGNGLWGNASNSGGFIIEMSPSLASGSTTVTTPIVLANYTNLTTCWLRGKGDGNGATILNYTPTSGIALSIGGGSGNDGGTQLSDFTITGTALGNGATAVQWGATAAQINAAYGGSGGSTVNAGGTTAKNVSIRRFTNGFTQVGTNSYAIKYDQCKVQQCTNGHIPQGENITMYGGLVGSCTFGINPPTSGGVECSLYGVAFDDNTNATGCAININNANCRISSFGSRFENPSNTTSDNYFQVQAGVFESVGDKYQSDAIAAGTHTGFGTVSGGICNIVDPWIAIASATPTFTQLFNSTAGVTTLTTPIIAPGFGPVLIPYFPAASGVAVARMWNVVPSNSIGASLGAFSNTQTALINLPLGTTAATSVRVGSVVRATVTGTCTTTASASNSVWQLHAGTAGTTADAVVGTATIVMGVTALATSPYRAIIDFTVTSVASGAGTAQGTVTLMSAAGGLAGTSPVTLTDTAFTATAIPFNTATFLTLSLASSTTTSTFPATTQAYIELVRF